MCNNYDFTVQKEIQKEVGPHEELKLLLALNTLTDPDDFILTNIDNISLRGISKGGK